MDANTLALMAQGFGNALDPMNLLMMVIGVTIGVIVGCMQGSPRRWASRFSCLSPSG